MVSIEVADVDGDGDRDVLGGSIGQGVGSEAALALWENRLAGDSSCEEGQSRLGARIYSTLLEPVQRLFASIMRRMNLGYQMSCRQYDVSDEARPVQ